MDERMDRRVDSGQMASHRPEARVQRERRIRSERQQQGTKDERAARGHPGDFVQQFAPRWDLRSQRQTSPWQLPWVREERWSQRFQRGGLLAASFSVK